MEPKILLCNICEGAHLGVVQDPVSTLGDNLDISLGSWSSLEMDEPAPPPPPPQGSMSQKLLGCRVGLMISGRRRSGATSCKVIASHYSWKREAV